MRHTHGVTSESIQSSCANSLAMASKPVLLYDISMAPPVEKTCCAVNPWKARYALSFKRVAHSTRFVQIPDIPRVRRELGLSVCRKFGDGSDFSTLPALTDPNTAAVVGDSLDIAVYLNDTYPWSGGDLFPEQALDYVYRNDPPLMVPLSPCNEARYPRYARFNMNVDAMFTAHVGLMGSGMPLDPVSAEEVKAEFVRRAGGFVSSYDEFAVVGEAREKMLASLEKASAELAALFAKDQSGPFLLGAQASYADLIVGAWLRMASRTLPAVEFALCKSWHGGVFGRLNEALDVYAEVKTHWQRGVESEHDEFAGYR